MIKITKFRFIKIYFIILLIILFIFNRANAQNSSLIFTVSNEQLISSQDFSFDISVTNTGATTAGIQTFQFVFELDKTFKNGGNLALPFASSPHYVSNTQLSSNFLPIGSKALVRSFSNNLGFNDLVFLNSDVVTSGFYPVLAGQKLLIARVVLHNTVPFSTNDPKLRFKFKIVPPANILNPSAYYSYFTAVSNDNITIFGNYTLVADPTEYKVNLNKGYAHAEKPAAPSLTNTNGFLTVNFTPLSRENGNYTGNIDTSAVISKYIVNLYDTATGNKVSTFEGLSSPIVLSNVNTGSYKVKIAAVNIADTSYFSNESNVVNYQNNLYSITTQSYPASYGVFNPAGELMVLSGVSQQVQYGPSSSMYKLDSVVIDGVRNTDSLSSYTFRNITTSHTVKTYYSVKKFGIKITSIGNGQVTDGVVTAGVNATVVTSGIYGSSKRFIFTPNSGYFVTIVSVKKGANGNFVNYYDTTQGITINNITDSTTIVVTFNNQYSLTGLVIGGNGTISPNQNLAVSSGSSITYTLTGNTGYILGSVTINGVLQTLPVINTAVYSYLISNITKNINLEARFVPIKAPKPSIVTDLRSLFITEGEATNFSINAVTNSVGTLSYNWYKKVLGSNTFNLIPNATGNNYTILNTQKSDSGTIYKVVVSNTWVSADNFDSVASSEALLVVLNRPQAPIITQQPLSVNIKSGKNAVFTVVARSIDGGTLSYQWQSKLSGAYYHWEDLNYDVNSNYFNFNNVPYIVNGTKYRVIVRNYINGVYTQTISDSAVLNVQKDNTVNMIAGAAGGVGIGIVGLSTALFLGIYAAGVGGVAGGFGEISSTGFAIYFALGTAAILTTGAIAISAATGTILNENTKDPATNYDSPFIYIQPQNFIAKQGTPAYFFVKARITDNGTLTYQWEKSENQGASYSTIVGARDSFYTTSNVNSGDNNKLYRVIVTNTHNGNINIKRYSNAGRLIYDNSLNPIIQTIKTIGGTVSETTTVNPNSNYTVTYLPNDGYEVDKVIVDNVPLNVLPSNNQYVFHNITNSHIFIVSFKIKYNPLNINIFDNFGNASTYSIKIPFGASYRISFNNLSNTLYEVSGYSLNGGNVRSDSTQGYTLNNIRSAQQLNIYLTAKTRKVKLYYSIPGKADTLSNTFTVYYSDTSRVRFSYNNNVYLLDSIFIDGIYNNKDSVSGYTFFNITTDHNIRVKLKYVLNNLSITKSYDSLNRQVIFYNSNQNLNVYDVYSIDLTPPNSDLYLDSFIVNGQYIIPTTNSYLINNIISNTNVVIKYKHLSSSIVTSVYLNNIKLYDTLIKPYYGSNYRILYNQLNNPQLYRLSKVEVNNNINNNYAIDSISGYTFTNITNPQIIKLFYSTDSTFYLINYSNKDVNDNSVIRNIVVLPNQTYRLFYNVNDVNNLVNDSVLINNQIVNDSLNSYTFRNVNSNQQVYVKQSLKKYKVRIILKTFFPNGTNDLVDTTTYVNYSNSYSLSTTLNNGYNLVGIYINGDKSKNYYPDSLSSYTFLNITSDVSIELNYAVNSYNIITSSNYANTIEPSTFIFYNQSKRVNFNIGNKFTIDSIYLNGVKITISDTISGYTFTNVQMAQNIRLFLSKKLLVVTTSSNNGGIITPIGTVYYDSNFVFSVDPYFGYVVDSVIVSNINGTINVFKMPSNRSFIMNRVEQDLNIRVVFKPLYTINITKTAGAQITLNKLFNYVTNEYEQATLNINGDTILYFPQGDTIRFNISALQNYKIDSVFVDGINVINRKVIDTFYSFSNLTSNRGLRVVSNFFKVNVNTIVGENGHITPGDTLLDVGDTIRYEFHPNRRYVVDSVIVNGVKVDSVTGYSFVNINKNATLKVTFKLGVYKIITNANAGGTISDTLVVYAGDTARVTYSANNGYEIAFVELNNNRFSNDSTQGYTFKNINGDSNLTVEFRLQRYNIRVQVGSNGSILPNRDTSITKFQTISYTIKPDTLYYIDTILINGVYQTGKQSIITFNRLDTDQYLYVTFTRVPPNSISLLSSTTNGGNITPLGITYIDTTSTSELQYTYTSAKGYHFDSLIINDTLVVKDSINSYTFRDIKLSQKIRTVFSKNRYRITTIAGINGSIDTSISKLYGSSVTIRINPQYGYQTDSILLNNNLVSINSNVNSYTIDTVDRNDTLRVTFKIIKYRISVSSNENGRIEPLRDTNISVFDSVTYRFVANANYYLDSVVLNGEVINSMDSIKFRNITSNQILRVIYSFVPAGKRRIDIIENSGGVVLPRVGTIFVNNLDSFKLEIRPNVGYIIDSVIVNEVNIGRVTSYKIDSVKEDYIIRVKFKLITYTVTTSSNNGGVITPSFVISSLDKVQVLYTPSNGYLIDSIIVNNVNVLDSNNGYTISNASMDYTIRVVFSSINIVSKQLKLRAFIEGYFVDGQMRSVLSNSRSAGCATCPSDPTLADSITVYLVNENGEVVNSKKDVIDVDGYGTFNFMNGLPNGRYYIVVGGRNIIQTWSAESINFNTRTIVYDFTSSDSKAYGSNMIQLSNGKWGIFSGKVDIDINQIDLDDINFIRSGILEYIEGYSAFDLNGDGYVTNDDLQIIKPHFRNFVSLESPFNN